MASTTISYVADRAFVRRVAAVNLDPRIRWFTLAAAALGGVTGFALVRGIWWLVVLAAIGAVLAVLITLGIQRPARDVQRALNAQFASLPQPATIEVDVSDDGLVFRNAPGQQMCIRDRLPIPASSVTPEAAAIITENAPEVTSAAG